jgi:hypothetical protein
MLIDNARMFIFHLEYFLSCKNYCKDDEKKLLSPSESARAKVLLELARAKNQNFYFLIFMFLLTKQVA